MSQRIRVRVRSPFVYSFGLALALSLAVAAPLTVFPHPWIGLALGGPLVLAGAGLFTWGWRVMRRHQVNPNYGPVVHLVESGPYRFSRNPLYLGLTVAYLGVGLAGNTWWPLVLLPLVLAYMHYGIIRLEEAHLARLFGEEYLAYQRRVRRWI